MSPLLSVVVPFYDVEQYLEACLESIARQTLAELEVVMVDDGSTDGSAAIAKEFARRDERFRLVQQENRGLGPARNAGVPHSSGRYLAFADSDDIIPRYAYELMVSSLERTGSDIACGAVRRFGAGGLRTSVMHEKIFPVERRETHVRRFPELLRDRTAWNKVFRREFWDRHGFAFPPGLYEDAPATIPAHVMAGKVDVLREVVYHWRVRETGARSITQRRTEPGNLEDRVRSVRAASRFLAEHAPDLKRAYDASTLADDIRIYVNVVDTGDDAYRATFLDLVNGYLDTVDDGLYAGLAALDRLKFHAVRHRLMDELVEIVSFGKSHPLRNSAIRLDRHPGQWFGDYPFLGDPRFPDHLYELSSELELRTGVDELRWHDGRLRIEGHAYISRLDAPAREDSTIEVDVRRRWLRLVPQRLRPGVERRWRPDVTAGSRQATANHDWAGFAIEIDPARLGSRGVWNLDVTVTAHGVTRTGPLAGPRGTAHWPPSREVSPGLLVKPKYTPGKALQIGVQSIRAAVREVTVDGGSLRLDGWVRGEDAEYVTKGELAASFRQGMTVVTQPVTPVAADGDRLGFTAVIDLMRLAEQTSAGDSTESLDSIDWDVSLTLKGRPRLRLMVDADLLDLRATVLGREYDVVSTKYGNLTLVERPPRLVVTGVTWLDGSTVELRGSCTDEGTRPDRLIMRRRRTNDVHAVPLDWSGPYFTALVNGRRETPLGYLPLPSGHWDFFAPSGDGELTVGIDRTGITSLPEPRFVGVHEIALKAHRGDLLHMWIRTALHDDERGAYRQRQMQQRYFGPANTAPLRDLVVFESYFAKQYSDNPKAIYEEMVRRDLGIELVWATADGQFRLPGRGRTVLRGSREYYETVATARLLVNNVLQMQGYAKRPGQAYLQTWHGTPYKHIGYDLVRGGRIASGTTKLSRFQEDVPMWDHLISPSPHVTGMLARAFRYDGSVLETGYPRNDMLFGADRDERARQIRRRLGVPEGHRVVLYVPTWREDVYLTGGRQAELVLDTSLVAEAVGDEYTVLVRQHHMVADRTVGIGDEVIDVTRYPDIGELYLAADAIITDYSSVMFDYAATGRPILFFTPDLEFYQHELRGAYFDLAAEAPGPLLRETGEVVDALRDLAGVAAAHSGAHAAFRRKYCAMDDGNAAGRVVDKILELYFDR